MDYEARLSTVEARQAMNQKDIDRLYQAISELRQTMLERLDRTDLGISELRKHTDHRIDELQKQTAAEFSELRREMSTNMRWIMGMWFVTIGMIFGLGGRVFGIY